MRLPKEIVVFLLVATVLPVVRAGVLPGDCSQLSGWQATECENILEDNSLSLGQKEDLYLNLLESQDILPSHGFALAWNRKQQFGEAPLGVESQSSGVIKDAWVKLVSIHKSLFDLNSGEWLAEPNGIVLSAYGYSIELPGGTEAGDCETHYSLESKGESESVFVNGSKQGEGKEVAYLASVSNGQEMFFETVLQVQANVQVDHYRQVEHAWWAGGIFPHYEYYYSCEFDRTEHRNYSVSAKDSFEAIVLAAEPSIKIVSEESKGYTKFRLLVERTEPFNEIVFSVGENRFSLSEASFDLNNAGGIAFVERSLGFSKSIKGFSELDFNTTEKGHYAELGATSSEPCKLTLFTDFEEKELPCNPIPARQPTLEIETDANALDQNQVVAVKLLLKDDSGKPMPGEELELCFGAKEETLVTNGQGIAEGSVSAADSMGFFEAKFEPKNIELKEASAVKRASVQNLEAWGTTGQVLGFLGSYYLIFLIVKKRLALGGC